MFVSYHTHKTTRMKTFLCYFPLLVFNQFSLNLRFFLLFIFACNRTIISSVNYNVTWKIIIELNVIIQLGELMLRERNFLLFICENNILTWNKFILLFTQVLLSLYYYQKINFGRLCELTGYMAKRDVFSLQVHKL